MKKIYLTFVIGLLGVTAAQATAGISNIVAGAASVTADTNGVVTWPAHPVVKNLDVQTNLLVTGTVTANGTILYGNSAHTNAVYIGPSGEVLSNAVGVVTIAGGSVGLGNSLNLGGTNYTINQTNSTATNYFAGLIGVGTLLPKSTISVGGIGLTSYAIYGARAGGLAGEGNGGADAGVYGNNTSSGYGAYFSSVSGTALQTGVGNVGIGTSPQTNFCVKGQINTGYLYATNDVSALTFTDRSDSPADLAEAARMLASCAVADGKVDHSKLDPGLWGKSALYIDTGLKTTNIVEVVIDATGKVLQPKLTNTTVIYATTVVPDQSKRNLSMLVSAQALVIQDLIRRIEKLEGK